MQRNGLEMELDFNVKPKPKLNQTPQTKKEKEDLRVHKRWSQKAARELGYGEATICRIQMAKTMFDVDRAMISARQRL